MFNEAAFRECVQHVVAQLRMNVQETVVRKTTAS